MAGEDREYADRVRGLPCCAPMSGRDHGVVCGARPSEAHHRTGAGLALRAHDHDAMPLCTEHHHAFHALTGPFRGWSKGQIRQWQARSIAVTRGLLLLEETQQDGEVF